MSSNAHVSQTGSKNNVDHAPLKNHRGSSEQISIMHKGMSDHTADQKHCDKVNNEYTA